ASFSCRLFEEETSPCKGLGVNNHFRVERSATLPYPKGMNHYDTIAKAIELITTNKLHSPSDEELAKMLGMSESHLRKVFTEWVGITPKQFSRYLSLEYSKGLLKQQKNHLNISMQSGLSSGGRLHDLFVDIEAMTPGEY